MTDWNAISAFMANVVPWPGSPTDPGYVNLHFSTIDRKNPTGPLRKGSGWPFRSLDPFIQRASWMNTTTQFKDAWYCLSLQSQTKPNAKDPTKPRAHRLAVNALQLKAIWIDIDVGIEAKKYPTLNDALKALIEFREKVGLPPFSALVGSGSGVHAYWISKDPMPRAVWEQYAQGLKVLLLQEGIKCDAGLTTDAARILRIPGTFNHKSDPPKPVQLLNVPLVLYDFPSTLDFLTHLAPVVVPGTGSAQLHSLFADEAIMDSFKLPPILKADPNETLGKVEEHLLDPRPIFTECGFYREALKTGGADYDNPLWNLSVLGTTFMENGNEIAHKISNGHVSYSEVDTQALYDRKVADRHDRGIGYPSCSTIAGNGCKSCASCPLFPKGKSPLNIRPAFTATVNPLNMAPPGGQQTTSAKLLHLPAGYDVDADGHICEVVEVEIGGEAMPPTLYKLFQCLISDPWAQANPDCLNFTVSTDKGNTHQASIKMDDMAGIGLDRVFLRNKVKIFPKNKTRLEHFIVSWLTKLHELTAAASSLPFGWYKEEDDFRGFVYGGKVMKDDGSEHPCGIGDPKLKAIFHPNGNLDNWRKAAACITNQKRPELDAIVALSFAAPLAALIGINGASLCAYGESGAGKTAAYSVGVAVWGHAIKGKCTTHSTFNGTIKKMGELSNLPLYWDEIKNPKAQAAAYEVLYNATDGGEKDRMANGREMDNKGSWQTLIQLASNKSFTDFVMAQDITHVAGVSRVLEYHVAKRTSGAGQIAKVDADMIIDKLKTSYGHMGLLYGKLLAMNHAAIQKECADTCRQVGVDMNNVDEERLWVSLVGTLLVGARLANTLGVEIDVPALKAFLYKVYLENRNKRDTLMNIAGRKETTEATMTGYFGKVKVSDQMLWTNGLPTGPGKFITSIIKGPDAGRNVSVDTPVTVRWDIPGRMLIIHKDNFVAYLQEAGGGEWGTVIKSLKDDYGAIVEKKVTIGAGTSYITGRATCIIIRNIGPDHDFAELMYSTLPPDQRPTPTIPVPPNPTVDTGLTSPEDVIAWAQGATRHAA